MIGRVVGWRDVREKGVLIVEAVPRLVGGCASSIAGELAAVDQQFARGSDRNRLIRAVTRLIVDLKSKASVGVLRGSKDPMAARFTTGAENRDDSPIEIRGRERPCGRCREVGGGNRQEGSLFINRKIAPLAGRRNGIGLQRVVAVLVGEERLERGGVDGGRRLRRGDRKLKRSSRRGGADVSAQHPQHDGVENLRMGEAHVVAAERQPRKRLGSLAGPRRHNEVSRPEHHEQREHGQNDEQQNAPSLSDPARLKKV